MKLIDLFNKTKVEPSNKAFQVVERNNASFSTSADVNTSDIVKACIRPKVKAIGKLDAKVLFKEELLEDDMLFLLNEPNEIDTVQTLLEKLTVQLQLNNNAFAVVYKNKNGKPTSIVPMMSDSTVIVKSKSNNYYVEFKKGNDELVVPYADVIHLRQEHNSKEYFGMSPAFSIGNLLKTITVSDEAVEQAVKNSAKLSWIMKFNANIKPEDMKLRVKEFEENYLQLQNNGGVAPSDNKYELEKVKQDVLIPDTAVQKEKIERIYNYFGVNEAIVKSDYNEDQWSAYYEAEIEPLVKALSHEFTRKLYNKIERKKGYKVIFTATGLQFASMESKLKLVELVDRGLLTPNEVRKILNLPAIADGDTPIRRLDTALVTDDRFKGGDGD